MSPGDRTRTTHFGYETVAADDKSRRVREVFDSVAGKYDLMNDLMSAGLHRLWKRFTLREARIRPGQRILDLAGGTGDLAAGMAPRLANDGQVVLADINLSMLKTGRDRLLDTGQFNLIEIAQVDAEHLPFASNSFDRVTMAFGLRNVTDKEAALASIFRVLKPGGKLLVLEFSTPAEPLRPAYDLYSFNILPFIGKVVADDEESYRYLAESIRMHPDQETLKGMLEDAGFERVHYHNLTGGVVALHVGYKI